MSEHCGDREHMWAQGEDACLVCCLPLEAHDRIMALEAEVGRLSDALTFIEEHTRLLHAAALRQEPRS